MLVDLVASIVAKHAQAWVADDLAAGDVGDWRREKVYDGLGYPVAVHVYAGEHHVDALEFWVLLNIGLGVWVLLANADVMTKSCW